MDDHADSKKLAVREIDSTAAEAIIALYDSQTALWAKVRVAHLTIEKAWLDLLTANLAPGSSILDIGCGISVPVAGYFIQQGLQVTGIDASPNMIARCRKTFPHAQWYCADMRTLALGQHFSALVAWDSFFHLTRGAQRQMFSRFAEHARPGARLLFNTGSENGEAIGRFADQELYHASLAADEYYHLLQQTGFNVLQHVVEDTASGGRTVWLAYKRE